MAVSLGAGHPGGASLLSQQNAVGRAVRGPVTVTFLYNGTATDCTAGVPFTIRSAGKGRCSSIGASYFLFSHLEQKHGQVSATATAEAFNPSFSLNKFAKWSRNGESEMCQTVACCESRPS